MAITEKQQRFIEEIAKNVQKYAYAYGILVHSPIIAQAIPGIRMGREQAGREVS